MQWAIPENNKPNRGVEDMEFPGVSNCKEITWNFQGLMKYEVEFSGVT